MRRYRLALLGSALAPAIGLALAMSPSTAMAIPAARAMPARGLPTLLTTEGGSRFAIRPATVVFLGDGSGVLGRLGRRERGSMHWTRWTGRAAFGRGTVWLNNCLPDCAQATYHSHRATVRAWRARRGHFTRLRLRYTSHGRRIVVTLHLKHLAHAWLWF